MTFPSRFQPSHGVFQSAHGDGPFGCHFCGEVIPLDSDPRGEGMVIHHLNHDHDDNRIENLAAAHGRCHVSYHRKSDAALKVGFASPEARAKLAATKRLAMRGNQFARGVRHSEQSRANFRLRPQSQRRTVCPSGHPYDDENTYVNPTSGKRSCRTCHRERERRRRDVA